MEISKELQKRAKNITVLYAEDEVMIQTGVHTFLKRFFNHVEVVNNGEDGLNAFKKKKYDLVITDIKMPKLNGLQMVKEIKKIDKNTKIIITSAFDDKKLLLNAISSSVDHYLVKPFDYSAFIVMLYKVAVVINLEKRVEKFDRHKQAILDFQDNMIFTISETRITSANKKFLNFFQLKSIKELYDKNFILGDSIVKEGGYYYPTDKYNLAEDFYNKSEVDLLVKLEDKNTKSVKTFVLKAGFLEEFNEVVITLTDVSDYLETGFETSNSGFECFFFEKTEIAKFFTFLKNEINRTKRYSLPFTIIQLKIETEDPTEEQIDKIDKLVAKELQIVDLLAKLTDKKFVIAKSNTDVSEANELSIKLNSEIKKQMSDIEDIRCHFGIVGLDSNDNMQDMLSRVEKLCQSAKDSGDANIKSDYFTVVTPSVITQEKRRIYNKLIDCEKKKVPVKLINFYEGMKIADSASITFISQKDERINFRISQRQYKSIDEADKVFIEMEDYSASISAEVEEQSLHDGHVTLKNLYTAKSSPLKREYIRITTEKNIPIQLLIDRNATNANILDLSIKSIAVEAASIKNLTLGKIINVTFSLPMEKTQEEISVSGEIYKIEKLRKKYKIVLILLTERNTQNTINSYISKRQQKLVSQMR